MMEEMAEAICSGQERGGKAEVAEVAEVAEAAEVDAAALYAALLFLPRHPTDGRPGGSAASPQQG